MKYKINHTSLPINTARNWKDPPWCDVMPLEINNYLGEKPVHFPKAQVRLLYDNISLYVFFHVEDCYVRAIAQCYHSRVWEDSCVEFFFTPGKDTDQGYFNIEVNAGGTMLFGFQRKPRVNPLHISDKHCDRVIIHSTMPKIIYPEITHPTTWQIQYCVPFDIIAEYANIDLPNHGVTWKANFYKCGDNTSHPHWLSWALIDSPVIDFHRPEYFGTLEFG